MTAARDDDEPAPSADMIARLHATLDDVPALAGPREVEALIGGLTNVNFKVTTPERSVVVRLSASDGDLLSIDRDAEHVNSRRAAESGAAAEVIQYLPEHHALIVAWIEGRALHGGRPARDLDAGAGRGGLPDAARRAAVRRGLRHVRGAAPLPRDRPGAWLPAAGPLPRADAAGGPDRRRAGGAEGPHGALQQRPARRQLHRRRRPALGDRLRVRRQRGPGLRARQHLAGVGPVAGPARGAGGRLHRQAPAPRGRPGAPLRRDGPLRLDPVGLDPGLGQPDRLRLLVVGDGEVRPGRRGARRPGPGAPACRGVRPD